MKNLGGTIRSIPLAATNHRNSLALPGTKTINRTTRGSRFGQTRAKKWIALPSSCATLVGKILRGRKFAKITVRVTTHSSSRTQTGTSLRFAAVRNRYLPVRPIEEAVPTPMIGLLQATWLPLQLARFLCMRRHTRPICERRILLAGKRDGC